jgi:molecular chaperone DnaK (HSP70)
LDGQTPELLCADGFVDFGGENFTARLVKQQMAILKEENRQKWERKMDDEEKRTVYRNVRIAMEKIKAQLGCKESAT